jgi:hypothetical protein
MENSSKQNNSGSVFFAFIVIVLIALSLVTCASRHRVGCHCWDGTESSATGSGACSHHGGVMYWEHEYWWDR